MTHPEQVLNNGNASSLIQQLGEALHLLEASKQNSHNGVQWVEVDEHFRRLDSLLKKKFEELEARETEYKEKEAKTHALLAQREAAVVFKEQDLLDRIQELKDAAVAVIAEARASHQQTSSEYNSVEDNKESKVSSLIDDTSSPEDYPHKRGANVEGVATDGKPRPELTHFCEQMDAKGLLTFVMNNQKNVNAIRQELSFALESATEPARLVLASMEGCYPPDTQLLDERNAAHRGMRRSCAVILEAMATLLARIDPSSVHFLNPEIKQQAKAIADGWKPKLVSEGINATNVNTLEAHAFLQLLSTFRIASEFDEEELCKLVLVVASRRQAPELCRSLGLTHKVPGVIESLVNSGKQIDAVHFSHAFQLTESFPSVPLLKTYLKDLRRNSQGKGGNSGGAAGSQNDANAQEMVALRAIIRCVEEYKLEADYPLDPLQKRLAQLERSKYDRKRVADFGKNQPSKKSKPNGKNPRFRGGAPAGAAGGRHAPSLVNRTAYTGMPERYPHAAPIPYNYQVANQSAYGQQATDQRMYYYPQDNRAASTSYTAAPSNYGGYMGGGMQSSHPPDYTYM